MTPTQPFLDRILECEQTVRALREENEHLRRAALDFGALAERLNILLKAERRAMARWTSAMNERQDVERPGARGARTARTSEVATYGN
jgi:hypothetical protein